jgi:mono/diheme cytochrome c family protein
MIRRATTLLVAAVSLVAAGLVAAQDTAIPSPPAITVDSWREHVHLVCVDCHGPRRREHGLDLAAALDAPQQHVALWIRALDAVEDSVMPPEGGLGREERREWRAGLLAALDVDPLDPGRPTLRRLTRAQLRNVLRDLLGVDLPLERFLPEDPAGYGFDTTGDTLFVTPLGFELWFEAVDAALALVRTDEAALARTLPTGPTAAETRSALQHFVSRAFRRPASDAEVDARVELVRAELVDGRGFEDAYSSALRATLLAPSFLYRIERDLPEADRPWPLDANELAARLSFFLWGRLPDAELVAALQRGELELQTTRMLLDPRARWLATDFAAQWLGFAELTHVTPDVRRFSEFDERLRRSMRAEAVEFFADLVAADRSVLECLDSDHAFLDDRLARHYGIEGIQHDDVQRVPIQDRRRGGVLGMGAVLTVTSQPLRTSPVARGAWLLERLLAAPPPPPPPNAGTLPEDDRGRPTPETLRGQLERHRADPNCAGCHARIDSYGLALEPYDGIGRWRDETEGLAIDAAVTLPDGRSIVGPVALKEALRATPEPFVRAFAEHLFVYAVGRPPELAERPALDAVVDACAADGYRFSALVRGLVRLPAFTHRRTAPRPEPPREQAAPEAR